MPNAKDVHSSSVIAEVLAGDALSLPDAARVVPSFRRGKPTHTATVWRWAAKGVRIQNGTVVRLETCRIGGRQMTSRAALGRFICAQTPLADTVAEPTRPQPTQTKQQSLATKASAELDRLGL